MTNATIAPPDEETDSKTSEDSSQYKLAVPLLSDDIPYQITGTDIERIIDTAGVLARGQDGCLLLLSIVTVPVQTPLELARNELLAREKEKLATVLPIAEQTGVSVRGIVCFGHNEERSILNKLEEHDCDGVLLGVRDERSQRIRLLLGDTIEKILARTDCDVFVKRQGEPADRLTSILLAVSTGPNSGLAAKTTELIARSFDAHVHVLHVLSPDASDEDRDTAREIVSSAANVLTDVDSVETEIVERDDVPTEIVQRSEQYDRTVLGAPTEGLLKQFLFGSVPEAVSREAENSVLVTKQGIGTTSVFYRWLASNQTE